MQSIDVEGDELVSGINVTPLVDICLVLLIIMMVSTRIARDLSVPLDMPKSAGGDMQVFFRVDLTRDDQGDPAASTRVLIDDGEVGSGVEIVALAREAMDQNPETRAVIRADSTIPHGRVIEILDLLKQAGMNKVALGPHL